MCGSNGSIAYGMVVSIQWLSASMVVGLMDINVDLGILGGSIPLVVLPILLACKCGSLVDTIAVKKSKSLDVISIFPIDEGIVE